MKILSDTATPEEIQRFKDDHDAWQSVRYTRKKGRDKERDRDDGGR